MLPAAQCEKDMRGHWRIEYQCALVRDRTFAEGKPRSAAILHLCASGWFAANILRFNGIHNISDGRHRIAFGGISAILAMRVMY